MADNSLRTPGSGESIATDEVTYSGDTTKVQLTRLVHVSGTEGSKTVSEIMKAEDTAHSSGDIGLPVWGVINFSGAGADGDYAPVNLGPTGEARVLSHRHLVRVAVDSGGLTTATTSYTAGDQVGTQFTFAGCARASGGTGTLVGVQIISAADIIGPMDIVLTRASITLASDNAAYAISDSDALSVVAVVQLAGAFDIGNNRICQQFNLAIPYDCSGGTSLYGGLITRFAHTFFGATTDLRVVLWVELN